ncbi:MAG: type II toxin-antitoxin system RelE/ParE family toxin [Gallionellaceae bacterium]|nr:MAG: type II toxin-antitoxin system RelE/ParE family toxin [Gallionellaceae bacterium]
MKYFLHPDAEQDIADAALYYQQQAGSPLSQALFVEFERSVERLLQHPKIGVKWRRGTRRFVMAHFPYAQVYLVANDELRILAFAHQSRRPSYWRGREWAK